MTSFLLDVNVLLALSLSNHQHHGPATRWFESGVRWATTALTETAYVRLMATPQVVGHAITPSAAREALVAIRRAEGFEFVPDTSSLAEPRIDVARLAGSKLVTDFHLVNLSVSAGLTLATFDGRLVRALSASDRQHVLLLTD